MHLNTNCDFSNISFRLYSTVPISTPIMITVEDAADVGAFANYVSPEVSTPVVPPAPTVVHADPPQSKAAAAAPPAPLPAAPTPAPVVVAAKLPPPPPPAPATVIESAVPLPSMNRKSPLFATLAVQQNDYVALYGTTGITPANVDI
jgi:hypothetical protein